MFERSRKRLKGEQKVLIRKTNQAIRNGEAVRGTDLAKLNRIRGRIVKDSIHSLEE